MLKITKPMAFLLLAAGALLAASPVRAQGGEQTGVIVITVRLPADALLLLDDHKTELTGGVRVFQTPALPVGRHYAYTLKATSQGKEVTRKVYLAHGMDNSFDLRAEFLPGATTMVHPKHFSASGAHGMPAMETTINWGAALRTVEQALDAQPADGSRFPK